MRPIPVRPAAAIAILLLPLVLGSCSLFQPSTKAPPPGLAATACAPGNCVINVTVNGTCQSPSDIGVDTIVSAQAAVNMRWVLVPGPGATSASYSFASNGIDFAPPDSQFEVKPSPNPSEFRLMNHHRSSGDFYYFINIQGCAQKDPWVRNQ